MNDIKRNKCGTRAYKGILQTTYPKTEERTCTSERIPLEEVPTRLSSILCDLQFSLVQSLLQSWTTRVGFFGSWPPAPHTHQPSKLHTGPIWIATTHTPLQLLQSLTIYLPIHKIRTASAATRAEIDIFPNNFPSCNQTWKWYSKGAAEILKCSDLASSSGSHNHHPPRWPALQLHSPIIEINAVPRTALVWWCEQLLFGPSCCHPIAKRNNACVKDTILLWATIASEGWQGWAVMPAGLNLPLGIAPGDAIYPILSVALSSQNSCRVGTWPRYRHSNISTIEMLIGLSYRNNSSASTWLSISIISPYVDMRVLASTYHILPICGQGGWYLAACIAESWKKTIKEGTAISQYTQQEQV